MRDATLWGFVLWGVAVARLGFPPTGWWGLAILMPVPLWVYAARATPRRAAVAGWVFGLGFFGALLSWLTGTLETYGFMAFPVALSVFSLLVMYLSLSPMLVAWAVSRMARHGAGWGLALAPFAWTGVEGLRGWFLSGFGWGDIPQALWRAGWALDLAPWVSADGVRLLCACFAVAPAWLLVRYEFKPRHGRARPTVRSLWPPLAAMVAAAVLLSLPHPGGEATGRGYAAVVQGNVAQEDKWDPVKREEIFTKYREMTLAAAKEQQLDFVLWPETTLPVWMDMRSRQRDRVLELARQAHAPVVMGAVHKRKSAAGWRNRNSVYIIDAEGRLAPVRYDKLHLVPFGEYLPFGSSLPFVRKLAQGAGDFEPGDGPVALRAGPGARGLGPLVCFESIFPAYAAAQSRAGAELLLVLTNDAWFGPTAAPWQHLAYSAWRAAETGLGLVRAANTGISAVFDARGRLESYTRIMAQESFVTEVTYHRPVVTPQMRVQPYIWPGSLALALLGLFVMLPRRSIVD